MNDTSKFEAAARPRWGFAVAGVIALGVATVFQFAVGGLSEETLAGVPSVVTVPYGHAGKLGLSVPVALFGLALIVLGILRNAKRVPVQVRIENLTTAPRKGKPPFGPRPPSEEDVFAEEIADVVIELPFLTPPPPPPAASGNIPPKFGKPAPAATTPFRNPNADGGYVALSSTKYLNNGKPEFRKGGTRETNS